jgi:hypothetical protein
MTQQLPQVDLHARIPLQFPHEITPHQIRKILHEGGVLFGSKDGGRFEEWFFQEGAYYHYALVDSEGESEPDLHSFPASEEGLTVMLAFACFSGRFWARRLTEGRAAKSMESKEHTTI